MKKLLFIWILGAALGSLEAQTYDWKDPTVGGRAFSYRVYVPEGDEALRAAIVLVPGTNEDGRNLAGDKDWIALANRTKCALVCCFFRDIENYVRKYWEDDKSPKNMVMAMSSFSALSGRPELETVPLAFWGSGVGGLYGYYFSLSNPERTLAFVVNKAANLEVRTSEKNRTVPALWITAEKDSEWRLQAVTGLFAEGRRQGAPWSLVIEPGIGDEPGRSKALGICFLEDILNLRLEKDGKEKKMDVNAGWLGSAVNHEIRKPGEKFPEGTATSWLPGKNSAEFWQAVAKGQPDPAWWAEISKAGPVSGAGKISVEKTP